MAVSLTKVDPSRRITRSSVQQGQNETKSEVVKSPAPKKSKSKKKVKFVDTSPPNKENVNKNTSLVSDEGIDMSFTPHLNLPSSISRPQHKLEQNWTMWYSARNKKLSWIQNQVNLCSISTVEEFWHSYNQVIQFIYVYGLHLNLRISKSSFLDEAGKQLALWPNLRRVQGWYRPRLGGQGKCSWRTMDDLLRED